MRVSSVVTITEYKVPVEPDRYGIGCVREGHKSGIMCVHYFGGLARQNKKKNKKTTSC